uniref:Transcription initiation factor TFIID subunit 13 n=1 Tax=Aegilops tauschii subsp. strangulata TaxID=200361 RepID=A0A453KDK8_AEGTS
MAISHPQPRLRLPSPGPPATVITPPRPCLWWASPSPQRMLWHRAKRPLLTNHTPSALVMQLHRALSASVASSRKTHMMYGFGDDPNPLPETVALVEDIVVEYITDLVHKAENVASKRGKLLTEDFLYLIRKDMRKLHRSTELLSMNEELKQARKAFDVNEETLVVTNE